MARRIGIDTGGTFTDVAVLEPSGIRVRKLPSTPDDPARAVLAGLAAVRGRGAVDVVHGTTVGLNAVLTGDVGKTAFVTNRGFEDLIEIGRQTRTEVYDLAARKPVLPVPRQLRFGVDSRRTADGRQLERPTREQLSALRKRIDKSGVDAIAIGLLHSPQHPEDEAEIAAALRPLGVPITCSAELLAVHGEYERYAAAILNAAIAPAMGAYVARLEAEVAPGRIRLMRSSSGILGAAAASRFPARAVFSGPAGGVLATRQHARALELGTVAAFDMGGTSTDVCLVGATPQAHAGSTLAGLPLAVPAVEVHTIGCGGGSIASVDAGGALRVGPESAGAVPGPACYGAGDQPTVTDAHMVLGHMGAETLLGGEFPVDPALSVGAVERLGKSVGLGLRDTARGILEVAEVTMMRALMVITVERAVDPATVPLVAYGGAGGLHAASLARRLSMPAAVVPTDPGAFSAIGLALAAESHEEIRPVLRDAAALRGAPLRRLAADATEAARAALRAQGGSARVRVRVVALLRFAGQGAGLEVPFGPDLEARFRAAHAARFGFVPDQAGVELVDLRARAERADRRLPTASPARRRPAPAAAFRRRPPCGGRAWPVYRRAELGAGVVLAGPCLVEEATGVTVVPGPATCRVAESGLRIDP